MITLRQFGKADIVVMVIYFVAARATTKTTHFILISQHFFFLSHTIYSCISNEGADINKQQLLTSLWHYTLNWQLLIYNISFEWKCCKTVKYGKKKIKNIIILIDEKALLSIYSVSFVRAASEAYAYGDDDGPRLTNIEQLKFVISIWWRIRERQHKLLCINCFCLSESESEREWVRETAHLSALVADDVPE